MTSVASPSLLGRLTHGLRRLLSYRRRFGWRATFSRLRLEVRLRRGLQIAGTDPTPPMSSGAAQHRAIPANQTQTVQQLVEPLATLRTYLLPPHDRRRVTLVTDSIARGSLFGGVGTAMILATLLANHRGADLRIVTRSEPPVPSNLDHVLRVYGLTLDRESQFRFVPRDDRAQEVDLMPDELVITTSWWTTAAALPSVPAERIVYLLQEDERMFYPFGDDRLRCEQVLRHPDIHYVVNTELLLRHFVHEGLTHIGRHGVSFEPAFPRSVYFPRAKAAGAKKRFVFYARPRNPRNLFFLGLEVIAQAAAAGMFDAAQWEIVFVGRDIPDVDLGSGLVVLRRENLDWADYADLVGGADLGLSLMYTPHPSYPPLDLAASGAVVVTNRHGPKQDLSALSPNLICCEPDVESLLQGLRRGMAIVEDPELRRSQHAASRLERDWVVSLRSVIAHLDRAC